jgi:hypothetical protein
MDLVLVLLEVALEFVGFGQHDRRLREKCRRKVSRM